MSSAHSSNRISQLLCLVLLLGLGLSAHGQACLQITCGPSKTVNCDASWAFDPPVVTNSCTCGQTNYTLTVVSTITNTIACPTQLVTQTWRVANGCATTVSQQFYRIRTQ